MIERLPGMAHPVQVRPADVERRAERRLFLGLLPISFSAEHIREVFEPFGTIQEIQVLGSGNQIYPEIYSFITLIFTNFTQNIQTSRTSRTF